jgi:hypothetical protein
VTGTVHFGDGGTPSAPIAASPNRKLMLVAIA